MSKASVKDRNMKSLKIYIGWTIAFGVSYLFVVWSINERNLRKIRSTVYHAMSNFSSQHQDNFESIAEKQNYSYNVPFFEIKSSKISLTENQWNEQNTTDIISFSRKNTSDISFIRNHSSIQSKTHSEMISLLRNSRNVTLTKSQLIELNRTKIFLFRNKTSDISIIGNQSNIQNKTGMTPLFRNNNSNVTFVGNQSSKQNNTKTASVARNNSSDNQSKNVPLLPKDFLKTVAPEIFNRVPEHFLPNYRNPCWLENGTLWCLPYFYIIGFHKSGTTDLFDKLLFHPSVLKVGKEPHWWAIRRLGLKRSLLTLHQELIKKVQTLPGAQDVSSFAWYLNWFKYQTVAQVQSSALNIRDENGTPVTFYPKVFGDGSVSTLTRALFEPWDVMFPGGENPDILPYLIHAIQPQAKIIITVRDPVSRFKSVYYRKFEGRSSPTLLHHFAVQSVNCARKCLERWGVRHCAYFSHCQNIPQIYLGIYVAFIKPWTTVYGLENILMLKMEDKIQNPVAEFSKVLNYLELENLSDDECRRIMNTAVFNQNTWKYQDMLPQTKVLLREFYKPYNKQLATFLNDDKYLFGY